MKSNANAVSPLRFLPSVDLVLRSETAQLLAEKIGRQHLTELVKISIDKLRQQVLSQLNNTNVHYPENSRDFFLSAAEKILQESIQQENRRGLRRVINATGVIIHTNLGRAPLAERAIKNLVEHSSRYCTLEYDLENGQRGRRGGENVENLLCELTGAESALIVNNCAAAAFLTLTALARSGETIVSRGELVEIGGDFRVPEVMAQSGSALVEVGTTNRTKLSDFARAITENTKVLMRVHPSNYRIIGFTAMPELSELAALAKQNNVILYEDAGSGALIDLKKYGLEGEPVIADSIKAGVDIITFSGDKLLGGIQAGIIAGRKELVGKLRKHPLYRALRVSKIVYAVLEATLESYRRETAANEIPVLQMMSVTEAELEKRSKNFVKKFRQRLAKLSLNEPKAEKLTLEHTKGESAIGGGSAPTTHPKTTLISLHHKDLSTSVIAEKLRLAEIPVIGRIVEDRFLLDLRTVSHAEEEILLKSLLTLV
jgi:L-seryl-tRNA(Ser) seleniumtransferase